MKKKRFYGILTFVVPATFLVLLYQNCTSAQFSSPANKIEEEVLLSQNPFGNTGDPFKGSNSATTGYVFDLSDSTQASRPFNNSSAEILVTRCTQEIYEQEKKKVLDLAKNDKNLIPVTFSLSTGDKFDDISNMAYERSILRKDDDGQTEIYIAPASAGYRGPKDVNANSGKAYYLADHSKARENFITGKSCFFDTVQILEQKTGDVPYKGGYNHQWANMLHGDKYKDGVTPDRLYDTTENLSEPQIVQLYIADIRSFYLSSDTQNVMNEAFNSSKKRGDTIANQNNKDIFHLDQLFKKRDAFIKELEHEFPVYNASSPGYDGISQLFDNIIFGMRANVFAFRYTPIVLDLGKKNILTSSLDWGSFFNLANHEVPDNNYGYKRISHQVAWVGGHLIKETDADGVSALRRKADDGFLVLPDKNGEIHNASQLLSNETIVNGKTYEHGFIALQSMADKDCSSKDIRKMYLGPWDDSTYKTLKVWVDENRNGVSEEGEITSLEENGIAALNPCSYNGSSVSDKFGNQTHIRASFLLAEDLLKDGISEEDITEIESRLQTGKVNDGKGDAAKFNLMVDIYFKADPNFYLENVELPKN